MEKKINLRLSKNLSDALERFALKKNISLNGGINSILHLFMDALDKKYQRQKNVVEFRSANKGKRKSI
jgi:hypothetical protein